MKRVILGKTGIEISNVGLGGIPVQRITPEKTRELLEELAERGINYIDTARGYTVSEASGTGAGRNAGSVCAGDQEYVPGQRTYGGGYQDKP